MTTWRILALLLLLSFLAVVAWFWWNQGETRRAAVVVLDRFDHALRTGDASRLLDLVNIPAAISGRTPTEQIEFLTKALRDEISAEGLAVLQRDGEFGPLEKLFPQEGSGWAAQAGVQTTNCVAFKLERGGLRAEVVLVKLSILSSQSLTGPERYRVLRCNNVKQLAVSRL